MHDPVDLILKQYGIPGPWQPLPTTGLANRIYATAEVVIRIATDHPEAIPDARTESVAAPIAFAAGVLTPRAIAFDHSHALVDRPFSLWERIHGETLGLASLDDGLQQSVWRQIGQQLALLHSRVTECPDPNGYLDDPGAELDLSPELTERIAELAPDLHRSPARCFLHNDLHEMNVMCTKTGELIAILDWGDAGWGDPRLDFTSVPVDHVAAALEGYTSSFQGLR